MKLNGHFLNNLTARIALKKLAESNKLTSQIAYRVGRLHKRFEEEAWDLGQKAMALHKEYCKVDEKGNLVGVEKGQLEFSDPSKEKEHDAKFDELLNYEFEEKVLALNLNDIKDVGLTGKEIIALEPIIDTDGVLDTWQG